MPLTQVTSAKRMRLNRTRRLVLLAEALLSDSSSDSDSDSDSDDDDDDDDGIELLMLYATLTWELHLKYDRASRLRDGVRITSLDQIPDCVHFQRRMFRFDKEQIQKLMDLIPWPADGMLRHGGIKGHKYPVLECFLATLLKLSNPLTNYHVARCFPTRDEFRISEMTSACSNYLYALYARQTNDLSLWAFLFKESADAFEQKGMPIPGVFTILDGKLFRTCRPGGRDDSAFSGHNKAHGNVYQVFVLANGITIGWFGPGKGTNHTDAWHYSDEGLHDQLLRAVAAANQLHGPRRWCCFADGAYPLSAVLLKGFQRVRTRDQNRFNGLCNRRGRVSVEWNFGNMMQLFPFVDTYRKQKLRLNATAVWTHTAMLFHNWWVCCYGGQINDFFDLVPPTLERYFQV